MPPAVAAARGAVRRSLADLPADALVLVAVSGGADSLCLAASVAAEAPRLGLGAGAVTVDHGLQPGSGERAEEVAERCRELRLDPVVVARVEVDVRDGGPEAAARRARYRALQTAADDVGAAAVLLGHTLDDQAETVLLGLARGSGARSLAGMAAVNGRLRRPLLGLRRAVTAAACDELGLSPWDDPHNHDPSYARSRVRAGLLPALHEALGPGVPEALARTADLLRADADALDGFADDVPDPLEVATLAGQPAAIRSRLVRRAAIEAGVPAGSLTASHIADVVALVTDWHGQKAVSLPGGLVAERRCDRLSFR
jgi:tRNA(Ile)-lysidine synthase